MVPSLLLKSVIFAGIMTEMALSSSFCCKYVDWGEDWCKREDCLGTGCASNGFTQCSPLSDCICQPFVPYKTKNFCTVLSSCSNARADLDFAKAMVQLYAAQDATQDCIDALTLAICSYHFPLCDTDDVDYRYICDKICSPVPRLCGNITLPYFAAEGSRCKPAGMEGNEGCTAAGRARFSCFAADAFVNQLVLGGIIQPTLVEHVAVGDQVECVDPSSGTLSFDRVIFKHVHRDLVPLVKFPGGNGGASDGDGGGGVGGGRGGGFTADHRVPLVPAAHCSNGGSEMTCGDDCVRSAVLFRAQDAAHQRGYCALVKSAGGVSLATVPLQGGGVRGAGNAVYLVTKKLDYILVDGIAASVSSTGFDVLESGPFRLIDYLLPGAISHPPISTVLYDALESPILQAFGELILDLSARWHSAFSLASLRGGRSHVESTAFQQRDASQLQTLS